MIFRIFFIKPLHMLQSRRSKLKIGFTLRITCTKNQCRMIPMKGMKYGFYTQRKKLKISVDVILPTWTEEISPSSERKLNFRLGKN